MIPLLGCKSQKMTLDILNKKYKSLEGYAALTRLTGRMKNQVWGYRPRQLH